MPTHELPSLDLAREILVRALAESPADRTEISWTEAIHRQERSNPTASSRSRDGGTKPRERPEPGMMRELSLVVRVTERGRVGVHRAAALDRAELANAIRQALADARLAPFLESGKSGGANSATGNDTASTHRVGALTTASDLLWDAEIADLSAEEAKALLAHGLGPDETARFEWTEGRIGFAASGAPPRLAALTGAALTLRAGSGPAAGSAEGVARSLSALAPGLLLDLTRERRAVLEFAPAPSTAVPLALAPKAVASLVAGFARAALDSQSIRMAIDSGAPQSWPLHGRLGERIASNRLNLLDDPTDADGLALPFDACGATCRPIELLASGVLRAAALTPSLAAALGLSAYLGELPLAIDFDQAAPLHLAVAPSDPTAGLALDQLLAAADDGLWIAALSTVEVYDAVSLHFRTVAHGVRRIVGGRIGPAVPNLIWEAGLLEVLSHVAAVGSAKTAVANGPPWLGATLSPGLVIEPLFTLRPV